MTLTEEQKAIIKKRCLENYWIPIDGNYSALDNSTPLGKCEAVIHEIAHGILLGIYPGELSTELVSEELDKLEARALPNHWKRAWEWNEVRTQALTILVLRMIGYAVTDNDIRALCNGARDNMSEDLPFGTTQGVKKQVLKLLETKKSARLASRIAKLMLGDDLPIE
jgi:hypothetical protein